MSANLTVASSVDEFNATAFKELYDVPPEWITLEISENTARRRLVSSRRRLSGSILVKLTISIPSDVATTETTASTNSTNSTSSSTDTSAALDLSAPLDTK